jgi:hypothetical protein
VPRFAQTSLAAATALAALMLPASAATATTAHAVKIVKFANCTAMHKKYPHGVGRKSAHDHVSGHTKPVTNFFRNNALYAANSTSDRDHDHIACEQH